MMGVFVQVNEGSPKAKRWPIGYVIQENGCWQWAGSCDTRGYGHLKVNGRLTTAHRWMYERHKGPIPVGMSLDHLCRNHGCVNPDHLEAVTHCENVRRGKAPSVALGARTHCNLGHPYDESNTYYRKDGRGVRRCLVCRKAYDQSRYLRHKHEEGEVGAFISRLPQT